MSGQARPHKRGGVQAEQRCNQGRGNFLDVDEKSVEAEKRPVDVEKRGVETKLMS